MIIINSAPISKKLLLTSNEVATKLGICQSYVWQLTKDNPKFPRPIKLSRKTTRWRVCDLEAYINSL